MTGRVARVLALIAVAGLHALPVLGDSPEITVSVGGASFWIGQLDDVAEESVPSGYRMVDRKREARGRELAAAAAARVEWRRAALHCRASRRRARDRNRIGVAPRVSWGRCVRYARPSASPGARVSSVVSRWRLRGQRLRDAARHLWVAASHRDRWVGSRTLRWHRPCA